MRIATCAIAGLLLTQAPPSLAQSDGPSKDSTPEQTLSRSVGHTISLEEWQAPPGASPRGGPGAFTWDNGLPLDDFGDPSSQLSEPPAAPVWQFIAGAADDFTFVDAMNPSTDCQITSVRVAFAFFQTGSGTATPTTTWNSVFVTIYPNDPSGGDHPAGQPDAMGGQTGSVVASQEVPAASLTNQTPGGVCRPYYVVDIPVSIIVQKNTKYWLSVVARHPAPPQSGWCLSQINTDVQAKQGFPSLAVPFWSNIAGNQNRPVCAAQNPPPAGTIKNLSFIIFAQDLATIPGSCCNSSTGICTDVSNPLQCAGPFDAFTLNGTCPGSCSIVTGACCEDASMTCNDNVNISACQNLNQRFSEGIACANVDPPCGTTSLGACCMPDSACQNLNPTDCYHDGGLWHAGNCATWFCPPINDACADASVVTNGAYPFDTRGASTDGPAASCSTIDNDIWYSYTATCDGTLTVSLCDSTDFDSALAVYEGCTCPPSLGTPLACNDNYCGTAGYVYISVTSGTCYLIRVGGTSGASGTGEMTITCIPTGSGACCHADQNCEVIAQAGCIAPGDLYTEGQPCSIYTCAATGACCIPDGTCQVLTQIACAMASGTYQGDSTSCTPNPCPPPTGACCLSGGACQEVSQSDCTSMSGIYHGDATTCTPNPCNAAGPDCCLGDIDNNCVIDEGDIPGFVDALLNPPIDGTPEFCRADVNEDNAVDGLDIALFIAKILGGGACTVACCPGDTNGDGLLDGLDVQGLVDAIFSPPPCGSVAFCRADVDQNESIELADVDAMVALLMIGDPCPP